MYDICWFMQAIVVFCIFLCCAFMNLLAKSTYWGHGIWCDLIRVKWIIYIASFSHFTRTVMCFNYKNRNQKSGLVFKKHILLEILTYFLNKCWWCIFDELTVDWHFVLQPPPVEDSNQAAETGTEDHVKKDETDSPKPPTPTTPPESVFKKLAPSRTRYTVLRDEL